MNVEGVYEQGSSLNVTGADQSLVGVIVNTYMQNRQAVGQLIAFKKHFAFDMMELTTPSL